MNIYTSNFLSYMKLLKPSGNTISAYLIDKRNFLIGGKRYYNEILRDSLRAVEKRNCSGECVSKGVGNKSLL